VAKLHSNPNRLLAAVQVGVTLSGFLSAALGAEKLILCTGAPGILADVNDPRSIISYTDLKGLDAMLASGAIKDGMMPKAKAIEAAIRGGVRAVVTKFDDEYWLARDDDGLFPFEFHKAMAGRLRTPAQGADTVIWAAAAPSPGAATGVFYFDRVARSTHLLPWTRESPADRDALWSMCEARTQGDAP
jgi:hypothetical protein